MDELLRLAMAALHIDRPVLACRLVGTRLEIWLLGAAGPLFFDLPQPPSREGFISEADEERRRESATPGMGKRKPSPRKRSPAPA